jgi:hypothetical protein
MGFGRSAFAKARNKSQRVGDHFTRFRVIRRIGSLKRVASPNWILSFIFFLLLFIRPTICRICLAFLVFWHRGEIKRH